MPADIDITPSIVIASPKRDGGDPSYEAKWRVGQKQYKRRLGPAWVTRSGETWAKRRGKTPEGYLDSRSVHVAAAAAVDAVMVELAAAEAREREGGRLTVRVLAHEWLLHLERVEGAKPSTMRDYRSMLAEPGVPHARGSGVTEGRLMAAFGDRAALDVTPKEVSRWLTSLHEQGLKPRNVNKHRQLLHSIYNYGMRADTHELPSNPVAGSPRRREAAPAPLDHYEAAEVEAIGRACAEGRHRSRTNLKGVSWEVCEAERNERRIEDQQDADLFRLLFYTGLRLGECRALKWGDVRFLDDMTGAVLFVQHSFSAGVESTTKSSRPRPVPAPLPAAQGLARLTERGRYLEPDDFVFCGRRGGALDDSALRRRYRKACEAAGLRVLRLHDLRHAAGSVMARSLPLVTVRDVLGHSKLQTTNRYLHGKLDDSAVAAMNSAFGVGASPDRPTAQRAVRSD